MKKADLSGYLFRRCCPGSLIGRGGKGGRRLLTCVCLGALLCEAAAQTEWRVPDEIISPNSAVTDIVSVVAAHFESGVEWTYDGVVARIGNDPPVMVRDGIAGHTEDNGGYFFPGKTITYGFDSPQDGIGGFVLWNNAGTGWIGGHLIAATLTFHSGPAGGGVLLHERRCVFGNGTQRAASEVDGDPNDGVNVVFLEGPLDGVSSVVFSDMLATEVAIGEFGLFSGVNPPPGLGTASECAGPSVLRIDFSGIENSIEEGYAAYTTEHETGRVARLEGYGVFGSGVFLRVSYPDTTDLRVRQSLDRAGAFQANYAGSQLSLAKDFIGADARENNGGNGPSAPTTLRFTLSGLPAGSYRYRSFHHDVESVHSEFEVSVEDAEGVRQVGLFEGTASTPSDSNTNPVNPESGLGLETLPSTVEFELRSDGGSDVMINYQVSEVRIADKPIAHESILVVNGLEIEAKDDYRDWRILHFGADFPDPVKEDSVWGDHADPEGDGAKNLLEFMMGLDPLVADSHLGPAVRVENGEVVCSYRQTKAVNHDVMAYVTWSTALKSWTSGGVVYRLVEDLGDTVMIEARMIIPAEGELFMRVEALRVGGVSP